MLVYCPVCDREYFDNSELHQCRPAVPVAYVTIGRWWCATCRCYCAGVVTGDAREVAHSCGTVMMRVASRLEVDDD